MEVEVLVYFLGNKHGILTKEKVSTLRRATTAALERAAYRGFEVVKELSRSYSPVLTLHRFSSEVSLCLEEEALTKMI
jgi:hypothetical protein